MCTSGRLFTRGLCWCSHDAQGRRLEEAAPERQDGRRRRRRRPRHAEEPHRLRLVRASACLQTAIAHLHLLPVPKTPKCI
jgi:hypothetical protein